MDGLIMCINHGHTISEREKNILIHMWDLENNICICVNNCTCEYCNLRIKKNTEYLGEIFKSYD